MTPPVFVIKRTTNEMPPSLSRRKKISLISSFIIRRPKKPAHPAAFIRVTVVHDRVLLFIHNTTLALVVIKRNVRP